jgi:uncharacterized protein (DUF2141 family)
MLTSASQAASLSLTVSSIPEPGEIYLGIFETAEGFGAKDLGGNAVRPGLVLGARQVVPAGVAQLEFELPEGVYAIKLFLDLNGNGEMDTNFLGIPKEPFGFSNNAKGKLGPPSFDAAAFQVRGDTEITIAL